MQRPTIDAQINQVQHNMTNHPPSEAQIADIESLREKAKDLGSWIAAKCPDGREKSLAQTNLEQALMWAVASIARDIPTDNSATP